MMTDPVRITGGLVSGVDVSTGDGGAGAVRVYKGIPFAAPPVGALRWRAPQPVRPWSGIRVCNHFGPVCQQPPVPRNAIMSLFSFDDPPECGMSEDCLYLNVWTGARSAADRLPVIVWIFGGGHRVGGGSHPVSWGTSLAKNGAVVVTFNYRLGALGFLAHPALSNEAGTSGNYGAMDVIAALRWVKDNIAAFGGDPDRVTIYGQSAGAAEVGVMMASPLARGLFHRAIGGSGGRFDGGIMTAPMSDLAGAAQRGQEFIDELGAHTLDAMRDLPPDALHAGRAQWGPIVDGSVLRSSVDAVFARGEQASVPLVTGFTSEEASPYPMLHMNTRAELHNFACHNFGDAASDFLDLYPAADDAAAHAQSYRIRRDGTFAYQAWRWASVHATTAKAPAYLYHFAHRVPLPADRRFREPVPPGGYGAWHGSELWYMFDTLGTKPFPWQADDHALARTMSGALLAFARDGTPGAAWPEFAASGGQAAILDDQIHAGAVPNRAALEFYVGRQKGKT